MSDDLNLTIDGVALQVPKGTTILQAAEQVGVEIPTFCYHPGLSAPANCRMCLVNTNKSPKLLPACYATCMDGMEVQTQDEKTLRTRKSTLEFILLHHPVDCPICDQAGECVLQDNYFEHSAQPSRLFNNKNHKPKAEIIGPNVVLDAERCIVCTRCVRFCEEVTETSELQVVNRGNRTYVTTFPGQQLDNDYATCAADICPVGALTSRDFRFKMRVWFLKTASSVCSGCSKGCNIHLDHGGGDVQRYRPRENQAVNQWWMCDAGRLSYKEFETGRIVEAGLSRDDDAVSVREAIGYAARKFAGFKRQHGADKVAVVPSLMSTNEDIHALMRLSGAEGYGTWYVGGRPDGKADALLQRADKNPNRAGLMAHLKASGTTNKPLSQLAADIRSGAVKAVVWVGHEHAADGALVDALASLDLRMVIASNASAWTSGADTLLPAATFEEVNGTWTNEDGLTQQIHAGPKAKGLSESQSALLYAFARRLGHMDIKPPQSIAQAVSELSQTAPEFADLEWIEPPISGRPDQAAA
ncbi:MAG: NADH-quinone oxidoreductase subunit G [Myxococcota bacterium]|jgi:NADH-quinone oxidoreductase subunit G